MKLTKDNSFNRQQFNNNFKQQNFENPRKLDIHNKVNTSNLNIYDKSLLLLPHQQSIEYIILNIRDMIFFIIEKLENQENPIPYIISSDKRIFIFSLFLIIFGTLMLLLSSLMKSPLNI